MSRHRRVAVAGAGFMGSMHAAIFARLRGCELAAIVDPKTAKHPRLRARGCTQFDRVALALASNSK